MFYYSIFMIIFSINFLLSSSLEITKGTITRSSSKLTSERVLFLQKFFPSQYHRLKTLQLCFVFAPVLVLFIPTAISYTYIAESNTENIDYLKLALAIISGWWLASILLRWCLEKVSRDKFDERVSVLANEIKINGEFAKNALTNNDVLVRKVCKVPEGDDLSETMFRLDVCGDLRAKTNHYHVVFTPLINGKALYGEPAYEMLLSSELNLLGLLESSDECFIQTHILPSLPFLPSDATGSISAKEVTLYYDDDNDQQWYSLGVESHA